MKGGNMWIFFYFEVDKTIDILHEDAICYPSGKKKPLTKGSRVIVQWGEDQHIAEIVAFSQEKEYLEQFGYDWSSKQIVKPGTKVKKQQEKNMATKRALAKGQKDVQEARKKTVSKFNELLLESGRKDRKSMNKPGSTAAKSTKIDKLSTKKASTVLMKHGNDIDLSDPEKRKRQTIAVKREEDTDVNLLACQFCPSLQALITPGVITVFETCGAHFKALLDKKSGVMNKKLLPWQIPLYGKVELVANSEVWVESSTIENLKELYKHDWKELLRKLLKLLVGERGLATMSAVGVGGKPGIPPSLYRAVQEFVRANCQIPLTGREKTPPFNRTVNLMCSQLAQKYASSIEKEGRRIEGHGDAQIEQSDLHHRLQSKNKKRASPKSPAISLSSDNSNVSDIVPSYRGQRLHQSLRENSSVTEGLPFPKRVKRVGTNGQVCNAPGSDKKDKKRDLYEADSSELDDMSDWLRKVVPGDGSSPEQGNLLLQKNSCTVSLMASRSGNFSVDSVELEGSKRKEMTTSTPEELQPKKKRRYKNDSDYLPKLHSDNSSFLNDTKNSKRSRNNLLIPGQEETPLTSKNLMNSNKENTRVHNRPPAPPTDGRHEEMPGQDRGLPSAAGQPQYSGLPQQQWNFPGATNYSQSAQTPFQSSYVNPYYHQYQNYMPEYYGSVNQQPNSEMTDPGMYQQNNVYHPL